MATAKEHAQKSFMHFPGVAEERIAQRERDRRTHEAMKREHPFATAVAAGTAYTGLFLRWLLVNAVGRAVIGTVGFAFEWVFRKPYFWVADKVSRLARWTSQKIVNGLKHAIGGVVNSLRFCFAAGRWVLGLGIGFADALRRWGILPKTSHERLTKWLNKGRERLVALREGIIAWGQNVKESIERGWKWAKDAVISFGRWTADVLEYVGGIGTYRLGKWIFNPRWPSGKPLVPHEGANKALGLLFAAGAATVLTAGIIYLGAWAKYAHAIVFADFFADPRNIVTKLLDPGILFDQTWKHFAIFAGVTSTKFFGLPLLAAAKNALKSLSFGQTVAHVYNDRLEMKNARADEPAPVQDKVRDAAVPVQPADAHSPDFIKQVDARARHERSIYLGNIAAHVFRSSPVLDKYAEKIAVHVRDAAYPELYEQGIKYWAKHSFGYRAAPDSGAQKLVQVPILPPENRM